MPPETRPAARPLLFVLTFAAVGAICIAFWPTGGRAPADQNQFHLPVIETFASQLPRPNVADYLSATTPGFHLVMAVVTRAVGSGELTLRLAGLAFTLPLIGLLAWDVANRRGRCPGAGGATSLLTPFCCSMYVLASAAWVLPDNMSWLGVLGVLIIALRARSVRGLAIGGGMVLVGLVLVRQTHVWAAAPLWVAGWFGTRTAPGGLLEPSAGRFRRVALVGLGTLPAFVAVAGFIWLWRGLTPPSFHLQHQGGNVAAPAFILTLIAIFSLFFAAWAGAGIQRVLRERSWRLGAGAAGLVGLAVGLLPETSYNMQAGRWSGLWNVAAKFPTFAERSPLIVAGSAAGAVCVVLWGAAISRRDGLILSAALAGFIAAQLPNHEAWQRYSEPFLLMMLALVAARTRPPAEAGPRARKAIMAACVAGPVTLAVLLAVVTIITM